jgi:protein-disulfide isomerase
MDPEQNTKTEEISKTAPKLNYAQFILPGAILLAALIISGTLLFTRNQSSPGTAQIGGAPQGKPVDIKINPDDHVLGNKDSKVTIVVYADFRCPFCERFYTQTEKQLIADYVNTGKARFIFRNFAFLGPQSTWASEAAECANEQGKYWEYYNWLFGNQAPESDLNFYSKANLTKYAGQVGLGTAQFASCLNSDKYSKRVADDLVSGKAVGVTGTPTLLMIKDKNTFFDAVYISAQMQARQNVIKLANGNMFIIGAQPYETFKQAIDALLK